jgi:hypothetical protein
MHKSLPRKAIGSLYEYERTCGDLSQLNRFDQLFQPVTLCCGLPARDPQIFKRKCRQFEIMTLAKVFCLRDLAIK